MSSALVCWSSFVSLAVQYPLQSRDRALEFLRFAKAYTGPLQLPPQSVNDANRVVLASQQRHAGGQTQVTDSNKEIADEWAAICKSDPKAPKVMDDVLGMIGLARVKRELMAQYHQIKLAVAQGDGGASSYNARFEGNPGTGKTTVARHYSDFLQQLGILPEGAVSLEFTAATLINRGVKYLEEELEKVTEAKGGVIFVDEAYQLAADAQGKRVLDFILPFAESLHGPHGALVWIFAGYQKDMEKLFEHNAGLPSRFPLRAIFKSFREFQEVAPKTKVICVPLRFHSLIVERNFVLWNCKMM